MKNFLLFLLSVCNPLFKIRNLSNPNSLLLSWSSSTSDYFENGNCETHGLTDFYINHRVNNSGFDSRGLGLLSDILQASLLIEQQNPSTPFHGKLFLKVFMVSKAICHAKQRLLLKQCESHTPPCLYKFKIRHLFLAIDFAVNFHNDFFPVKCI